VRRGLASVAGTVLAARAALEEGVAGNLAGGTHHAFRDYGEGFCVFNDIAVAALKLLAEGHVGRVAVVDLDVHQGNGTAAILGDDPRVFLLDMYGRHNYPFRKVPATLEVPLENGTEDGEYLSLLERALPALFSFGPDIIFYQAGVDVLKEDSLGKLGMTHEGIMRRDRMVLEGATEFGVPVVLTLGGGYSRPIEHSVRAYAGTYRVARQVFGTVGSS
jgi:acetoin utilization deacetylase AcuC-like enzyme